MDPSKSCDCGDPNCHDPQCSDLKCDPECGPDCTDGNCGPETKNSKTMDVVDGLVLVIFAVSAYVQVFSFCLYAFGNTT